MPKYRILIVENNSNVWSFLNLYFSNQGFQVFTTSSGRYALQFAINERPHVAIINNDLPDISGTEVVKQINSHFVTRGIHIIHTGPERNTRNLIYSGELSRNDWLTTPYYIDELRLRVQKAIERIERKTWSYPAHPITGLPFDSPENIVYLFKQETLFSDAKLYTLLDIRIQNLEDKTLFEEYSLSNESSYAILLQEFAKMLISIIENNGTPDDWLLHHEDNHFAILTFSTDGAYIHNLIEKQLTETEGIGNKLHLSIVIVDGSEIQEISEDEIRAKLEVLHSEQLQ